MVRISTGEVMKKIWLHLAGDFRTSYGLDFCRDPNRVLVNNGMKAFRDYIWPTRSTVRPCLFKALYQMESLFKRFRFENDAFTDEQLMAAALEKFESTQVRVAVPMQIGEVEYRVLRKARVIISSILGEYDIGEHLSLNRFGKRSCVGTPYRQSYLDIKLLDSPITGSPEHIALFKQYLQSDHILSGIIKPDSTDRFVETLALPLALVPKSFKSLRTMLPNTMLGSWYTAGLGSVIQDRLKNAGLNISNLQQRHRSLVKRCSRDRSLATADLSSASDSITLELLRRVLPVNWYRAITYGRAKHASHDKRLIQLSSVVTMGLGQTFPLQTLIFYGLIKAIGELCGKPCYVSVYGDDLIYSSWLHRYVSVVFPHLHLNLNMDKTYVKDFFRESCGSDCYHGVDVRPFQPEGVDQRLDNQLFTQFLYRTINGLRLRWEDVEIPSTLGYLYNLVVLFNTDVYQVPPYYPDGAGIKTDTPQYGGFWSPVVYARTTQSYVFRYLREVAKNRVIKNCSPYYWECLRSHSLRDPEKPNEWDKPADEPQIRWIKPQKATNRKRAGKQTHRRRRVPVVSVKGSSLSLTQTGSSSTWT